MAWAPWPGRQQRSHIRLASDVAPISSSGQAPDLDTWAFPVTFRCTQNCARKRVVVSYRAVQDCRLRSWRGHALVRAPRCGPHHASDPMRSHCAPLRVGGDGPDHASSVPRGGCRRAAVRRRPWFSGDIRQGTIGTDLGRQAAQVGTDAVRQRVRASGSLAACASFAILAGALIPQSFPWTRYGEWRQLPRRGAQIDHARQPWARQIRLVRHTRAMLPGRDRNSPRRPLRKRVADRERHRTRSTHNQCNLRR